jgi:hypothetical protein
MITLFIFAVIIIGAMILVCLGLILKSSTEDYEQLIETYGILEYVLAYTAMCVMVGIVIVLGYAVVSGLRAHEGTGGHYSTTVEQVHSFPINHPETGAHGDD